MHREWRWGGGGSIGRGVPTLALIVCSWGEKKSEVRREERRSYRVVVCGSWAPGMASLGVSRDPHESFKGEGVG